MDLLNRREIYSFCFGKLNEPHGIRTRGLAGVQPILAYVIRSIETFARNRGPRYISIISPGARRSCQKFACERQFQKPVSPIAERMNAINVAASAYRFNLGISSKYHKDLYFRTDDAHEPLRSDFGRNESLAHATARSGDCLLSLILF